MDTLVLSRKKEAEKSVVLTGYNALSPATRSAYERDLNEFFTVVGKDVVETEAGDVLRFLEYLERQGYRNSTRNRKISAVSKVMHLYKLAGLIKENPIEELGKVRKLSRPVSHQQTVQIDLSDVEKVVRTGTRTSLVVSVLANTGLRVSELIGIRLEDIEDCIEDGKVYKKIRIVGKRKKERYVFLPFEVYKAVREAFTGVSEYLFHSESGRKLNRINLYKQIQKAFLRYTGKRIHPHTLRHFYATYKINTEKQDIKAVSRYLGHSSTAITLDMYVDTALSPKNSAVLHNPCYVVSKNRQKKEVERANSDRS